MNKEGKNIKLSEWVSYNSGSGGGEKITSPDEWGAQSLTIASYYGGMNSENSHSTTILFKELGLTKVAARNMFHNEPGSLKAVVLQYRHEQSEREKRRKLVDEFCIEQNIFTKKTGEKFKTKYLKKFLEQINK